MMDVPAALIAAFPPSADLLLSLSRRPIDDEMLGAIARADYGELADEMLLELRPIRDHGMIPSPLDGQLAEVLSLIRWCDPENPDLPPFEPGPTGRRGHQTRLFACAVLLRATGDGTNDSALAQALASAKVLGIELSEAIGSFLTWQLPRARRLPHIMVFAMGLLVVAIRLRSRGITDQTLGAAAEWILTEEVLQRQAFPSRSKYPMPRAFSIQHGFWEPLAAEFKTEAATIPADDIRTNLELCAQLFE